MVALEGKRFQFWQYFLKEVAQDIKGRFKKGPTPFKNAPQQIYNGILNTLILNLDPVLTPTIVAYINTHKERALLPLPIYDFLFSGDHASTLSKLEEFHSPTIINVMHRIRRFKFHFFQTTARIYEDWDKIKVSLNINDSDVISDIKLTSGDEHYEGAQTSIFRFNNGEKGFIYKPINLSIDLLMHGIRTILNDETNSYYPPHKIIAKNDNAGRYGYIGLFKYRGDVNSLEEAQEVYYNFGALLAWGKFFKTCDGHCDNVIISAPHVHWVDLETAFHFMHDTVYPTHPLEETGLLYEAKPENTYIGIVTGIQGGTIPRLGLTSPTVYQDGTDDMFIRYFKIFHPTNISNRCYLDGVLCKPEDFSISIKNGYTDTLKSLYNHKEQILDFIAESFKCNFIQNRYLIQTTASYARFVGLLNHIVSHTQGDVLAKIRAERVKTIVGREKDFEAFIVENELLDISNGVIPYFYRTNQDKNLYHASGAYRENFFANSLLEEIQTYISNISIDDAVIASDCTFIDQALNSTSGITDFETFQKRFNFAVFDFHEKIKNIS